MKHNIIKGQFPIIEIANLVQSVLSEFRLNLASQLDRSSPNAILIASRERSSNLFSQINPTAFRVIRKLKRTTQILMQYPG